MTISPLAAILQRCKAAQASATPDAHAAREAAERAACASAYLKKVPRREAHWVLGADTYPLQVAAVQSGLDRAGSVVVAGPPGTGKSCAAAWLCWARQRAGIGWEWLPAHQLSSSADWELERALGACARSEFLVVDDLGVEPDRYANRAAWLVDRRYEVGRPTIITTNLTRTQLAHRYHKRTVSRLAEMSVIVELTEIVRPRNQGWG